MQDKHIVNQTNKLGENPTLPDTNELHELSSTHLNTNDEFYTFKYEDITINSIYDDAMPSLEQKLIEFLIRKKQDQSID